jgi:hypothetical protein
MKIGHEEKAMLQAFVESPVYGLLLKLTDAQIEVARRFIEQEKDTVAIYRWQGMISGLRYITGLSHLEAQKFVAEQYHEQQKKERELKKAERKKRVSSQ